MKLNVNTDTIREKAKCAKLNTKILNVILNAQILKMI